jgi:hypothetical protein
VEGDAVASTGRADESGKSGLVMPDDLVAESVDASAEVLDENVHDDVSVVERGCNSHIPQTSASNDGAFDERMDRALDMATDDYKPLMGLNDVDSDVVLEQFQQATLTEENVQKWDEMLGKCLDTDVDARMSKRQAMFRDVIESGSMDARGTCAQQFRAAHGPNSEAGMKYRELKTREEQQTFRMQWAHAKYNDLVERTDHLQSWQRVDTKSAIYAPFGALVQEQGGWHDQAASKGVKTQVAQASKLGGDWVQKAPANESAVISEALVRLRRAAHASVVVVQDPRTRVDA